MAAGSIVVDLLLKTGSFSTDTARASKDLKKFQKDAEAAGKALGVAFTGAVVGLAALVKSSVDSADHLNDLSKKTGIAADTLGGIGFAAEQAGGDLESAALGAGKLNKSLAEAAAGNKEASEAFQKLGISVKDATGKTKLADVALAEIADKFAGYADGPEKVALALRIFGKAGADMIPLLNDGGAALLANIAYFKRYSGVTQEVAEAADKFNDTQSKIKLLSQAFGNTLAAETLPLLQTLADRFLAAKEQGDGFKSGADGIVSVLKGLVIAGAYVADTFRGVGREIGALAAQGDVLSDAFSGASLLEKTSPALMLKRLSEAFRSARFTGISEEVKADGERAKKQLASFVNEINNPFVADPKNYSNEGRSKGGTGAKPAAPRLAGAGTDTAGQELKKRLEGQLRIIQDAEKAQAAAYRIGESYLDGVYQDGLISQREFFDAQKNLRDANLSNVLSSIDQEIAAQRKFLADPKASATDRVSAEEKIKLAVQQRAEAVTAASGAEIGANQANARAAQQLADAYANLKASVLSAQGNDVGVQAIKDAQTLKQAAELIRQAEGDPQVLENLKAVQAQQTQRTQLQKDYAKLLDDTSRREAEIYIEAEAGGKNELETLAAIRDARQSAIGLLQQQAQAAALLAAQSGTDADLKNAKDLSVAFKKASAELDPLAAKFNGVFEDSFANAFTGFLTGAKSAKQAFKDFANSVIQEIANIAAKNLAQSLFGGTSGSGGIGGIVGAIASLFGGGSYSYNGGVGTTNAAGISGGRASGGSVDAGKNYIVGERGPEILRMGSQSGSVLPNSAMGGGNVNITYKGETQPRVTSASRDEDGTWQIFMQEAVRQAKNAVASEIASGTGVVPKSMRGRGLNLDRSNQRKG